LKSAAPTDTTAADSVVHKSGKKRKRTLSGDVRPTVLQTVCEGCRRKSYPHGENWKQGLITICHKCNKEWHAQCMKRKGIQRGGAPGQWECRDCSRKGKPQPPRPAHTDNAEEEVMVDQLPHTTIGVYHAQRNRTPYELLNSRQQTSISETAQSHLSKDLRVQYSCTSNRRPESYHRIHQRPS
jgi:hypothetical protein